MAEAYHLAEINIARMLYPREDARMAGFFARLDEINNLAETSPGFVWRLRDDSGNATYVRAYDDDQMLVNLSVWESLDSLAQFTYRSSHRELFGTRKQWFEVPSKPYMALWWVRAGHTPTVEEATERLAYLEVHGPTPYAFGFKSAFPAPSLEKSAEAGAGL